MPFRQIESTARIEKMRDDCCPATNVRQPVNRTPIYEYQVKRFRHRSRCVVQVRLDEPRSVGDAQLCCQSLSCGDCRRREIDPDDGGIALRQSQCFTTKMSLEMEDSEPIHRADLCLLDWS
jgi:hypothetical protein